MYLYLIIFKGSAKR